MGSDGVVSLRRSISAMATAAVFAPMASIADSVPTPDPFAQYVDPQGVVLAVQTPPDSGDAPVRLVVYAGADTFLETASAKYWADVNEDGAAIVNLGSMPAGDYAFVAYVDENRDGKLNRGWLGAGKPKEPYAFSNGVRPKLRRPRFDEAKVDVSVGSVVVIEIED
ncbi:MAG: DUF2141 domain-containing protein [Pseudomonadota bacterium]